MAKISGPVESHQDRIRVNPLISYPFSIHSPRHAHARIMLHQVAHPKIVQKRLGHSTISVTLDTYSHVAPGLQEAAANRFDEAFNFVHNNSAEKLGTPQV